jgi:hypothetical protein
MKRIIFVILILVVLGAAIMMFTIQRGPNIKQFEHLTNPVISEHPNQNMLVVETKGDPNQSAPEAIKILFKTYYSLKGVSKDMKSAIIRSRWPVSEDTPKDQWIGYFAMPIPADIQTLPELKNPSKLKVYITEWEYGTVAEILHKGSYADEKPTVQRLKDYIDQQGYQIIGMHEEQYIKGPGMFGPGNPAKYLTIISYRVEKK